MKFLIFGILSLLQCFSVHGAVKTSDVAVTENGQGVVAPGSKMGGKKDNRGKPSTPTSRRIDAILEKAKDVLKVIAETPAAELPEWLLTLQSNLQNLYKKTKPRTVKKLVDQFVKKGGSSFDDLTKIITKTDELKEIVTYFEKLSFILGKGTFEVPDTLPEWMIKMEKYHNLSNKPGTTLQSLQDKIAKPDKNGKPDGIYKKSDAYAKYQRMIYDFITNPNLMFELPSSAT